MHTHTTLDRRSAVVRDAIEALPEVADARARHERIAAAWERHLDVPTYLRQRMSDGETARMLLEARLDSRIALGRARRDASRRLAPTADA